MIICGIAKASFRRASAGRKNNGILFKKIRKIHGEISFVNILYPL